jgi:hypothetical protein
MSSSSENLAAQKHTRVAMSTSLLNPLQSIRHQGWQYIVTLDEAWFYFVNQSEQI